MKGRPRSGKCYKKSSKGYRRGALRKSRSVGLRGTINIKDGSGAEVTKKKDTEVTSE
jgi:hypothetical protein